MRQNRNKHKSTHKKILKNEKLIKKREYYFRLKAILRDLRLEEERRTTETTTAPKGSLRSIPSLL